ncbi:MAG: hypothetical protein Q9196_002327 [Gyalolechia fulgens]
MFAPPNHHFWEHVADEGSSLEPLTSFVSVCDHNASAGGIHLCCDSGRTPGSCCKNTSEVFTLAAPFSSITAGPATPTNTATAAGTESPSPATTTTSSETVPSALQSSIAPGPTQAMPTTVPESQTRHGATVGAAVGGGVGGGIVLGTIALLWLWRRRRSKKRRPKRLKISRPFELPSHDPTFGQNSMLFPAELHPQMSNTSIGPAELEHKDSQPSIKPAELEHKDSGTTTSTGPNELMAETEEGPAGPFELHGREIDSIMGPPSPVKFDEKRRWPFSRAEPVEESGVKDALSAHDVRMKRPTPKRRPGSVSGPWHDNYC